MAHPAHTRSSVSASGGIRTPAGTHIPEADIRTRQIARQARSWRAFAGDHSRMQPDTLDTKAFDACAFSVHHRASSFAVPSKLVGTSRHQPLLRSLSQDPDATWLALDLDARGDHLVASHGGRVLGRVQPKHLGWVRPLVPFGLRGLPLPRDGTGRAPRRERRVLPTRVQRRLRTRRGCPGEARERVPRRRRRALRAQPQPASARRAGRTPRPNRPAPARVPVLPEAASLTGDADDIVLWRTLEGEAHASVPHATRHSPTGIEWGYGGSGPADLARSILLALLDEPTADALYQRFKQDVVTTVPEVGGVLRAADIRAWVEHARTR